jgi:uncharacterized protein
VIVVDTGPLVAIADADDRDHARCIAALGNASRPLVVPPTVLAEVCYLLERELGTAAEAAFLQSFRDGPLTLAHITLDDLDRMAVLVTTYADLPLGAVDASLVAVAERLGITEIATLDLRHFTIVRPRHADAFTLLPSDRT